MQKFIALLAALALCVSFSVSVGAAAFGSASWSDIASQTAGMDGSFVSLNAVGLKFWLPGSLKSCSLPVNTPDGYRYLGFYMDDEQTAELGITRTLFENNQLTIDEVAQALRATGTDYAARITVNGYPCLTYSYDVKPGLSCDVITVLVGQGTVVEFAFIGVASSVSRLIVGSIQPV